MTDLMLLSSSFSPGRGLLEHALDALEEVLMGCGQVLFVPYAGTDPDAYTGALRRVLAHIGVQVAGAHRAADPLAALAGADAVYTGGGSTFRLLRAVQRNGLLPAMGDRVRAGMPYIGESAGALLACPTIRTTNDMPITEPDSLAALGLIPFQLSAHYPAAGPAMQERDFRLREFLEQNDVPVLGLREGSWLRVSGPRGGPATRAAIGGTTGGRLLARGNEPREVQPGDDMSDLLAGQPAYDSPLTVTSARLPLH